MGSSAKKNSGMPTETRADPINRRDQARRDAIVEHFRRLIEESGGESVFYDLGLVSSQPDPSHVHHGLLAGCCKTPGEFLSSRLPGY